MKLITPFELAACNKDELQALYRETFNALARSTGGSDERRVCPASLENIERGDAGSLASLMPERRSPQAPAVLSLTGSHRDSAGIFCSRTARRKLLYNRQWGSGPSNRADDISPPITPSISLNLCRMVSPASVPSIRPPEEGDWQQVAELMSICFDEELKAGGFPDTAESLASQHARGRWCRVMSMGTRIIGFVCLDDKSTKGSASKLAVDPEFRGKGYAQLLMKAAEAGARDDLKWKDLYVAVVKTKPRLLDLYKNKLGYVDPQLQNTALQMREGFEPVPVTVLCKEL